MRHEVFASELEGVVPEADRKKILGGNLERLLAQAGL